MTARKMGSPFVANGHKRALVAGRRQHAAEVAQEFAPQLEKASFWQRLVIRHRMRREIKNRARRGAPHDALY